MRTIERLALALVLLLPLPLLAAPAHWDVPGLLQALHRDHPESVRYTEEKRMEALSSTMRLHGTLTYRPPNTVEKRVGPPYNATYTVQGERITLQQDGQPPHQLSLQDAPGLAGLIAGFRAVLSGDYSELDRYYRSELEGDWAQWKLSLTPRGGRLASMLHSVVVRGHRRHIDSFTMEEAGGDSTVLRIEGPAH